MAFFSRSDPDLDKNRPFPQNCLTCWSHSCNRTVKNITLLERNKEERKNWEFENKRVYSREIRLGHEIIIEETDKEEKEKCRNFPWLSCARPKLDFTLRQAITHKTRQHSKAFMTW